MLKKTKTITQIAIFEGRQIRRVWDEKTETWFFSVVDIIQLLTESVNPTDYLKKLRKRDKELANYLGTNCPQVEMFTEKGKKRKTLAGNPEHLFRIIQSVPSPKAEPIKLWLARVGYERLKETTDPSIAVNRARNNWKDLGRSEKWITQRMRGQEIRNKLTDYWSEHDVTQEKEYALLTDIIHKEWSDLTTSGHKSLKKLKQENLRDHMSEAELLFTALAELSTAQIANKDRAIGYNENVLPAKKGGAVAKRARKDFELQTGQKVVSGKNFLLPKKRVKKLKQ
jgi:DNA-damage-inducible protein D